jgi:hypothetical protein
LVWTRWSSTAYCVSSQASYESDPQLSQLCEQTAEIVNVLENEELASTPESAETRVREWLNGQGLGVHMLLRLRAAGTMEHRTGNVLVLE